MTIRGKLWTAWAWMACQWITCICMTQTASAQQTFMVPVSNGRTICTFNSTTCYKTGYYHTAIDYGSPTGQSVAVLASNVGVVHYMVANGNGDHGMGNCVIVRHAVVVGSNGSTATYYTLYAHLASFANGLKVGQIVNRGQALGMMGSTGAGDGMHLHFEVKTIGVTENPYGGGPYWGYTPKPAQNYGYIDPATLIGKWTAVPITSKN